MDNFETIVLNKSQKATVDQIKGYLRNKLKRTEPFICDHFINRFLIARKWDEKKTIEMLTNYFTFRDSISKRFDEYTHRKGTIN